MRTTVHFESYLQPRGGWTPSEALALMEQPLSDLLFVAQQVHRHHFDPNEVQLSTLLSIKTGGCPEDCGYCQQSAHHEAKLPIEPLMTADDVVAKAELARERGATRFCMGAAWRNPRDRDMGRLTEIVRRVKDLGLETCMTLGMLSADQAEQLKQAGLDFYNHNIDTSEEHYAEVITTRTFADRLDTLQQVRRAGLGVCCGGIVGMGEERADRASMLVTLANLEQQPQSVPINMLVRSAGTPLADAPDLDPLELVRTVATARLLLPRSTVRLSAGREQMTDELQALCFFAGTNSIFYGSQLLTTSNAAPDRDRSLFARLGLRPTPAPAAR